MGRLVPKPAGYHWDVVGAILIDGRKSCRWCKGAITAPRRVTFCGEACVHEWRRRTCPQVLRAEIHDRDRGICVLCGLDLRLLDLGFLHRQLDVHCGRRRRDVAEDRCLLGPDGRRPAVGHLADLVAAAARRRFDARIAPGRDAWDVDHVIPVVEGGDHFDPANLRLLCVPCHRGQTALLAARRKAARQAIKVQARGRPVMPSESEVMPPPPDLSDWGTRCRRTR